ncbi:DUF559 domain-containing protein [Maribellus sp. CM-23]|uniref:endonuclease domain-containing protein n=1 Tax=Maribellus sp. CM-23 TaxID=2781026 RepID=UPI001F1B624A|nr:endonuclease domain-containing protein [Maribellus sp. CM-23]MCE4567094.1 DUF559 domain-containing protein [Maribellus sp. CM-23]
MDNNDKNKRPGWHTANADFYRQYSDARRYLLLSMTSSEKLLWQQLRGKKLGVKFRRQHVIETFIPDFVALSIKLIVEVDGKIHLKQKHRDKERTEFLEMMGYKVIRFTNEEVESDIDEVIRKIKLNIELLTSPNLPNGEEIGS